MRNRKLCYRAVTLGSLAFFWAGASDAGESAKGKALLGSNCGRCHALTSQGVSQLKDAPNLWIVLSSYPEERLTFELSEGIGSRHKDMPQIQFSSDEIMAIRDYLTGEGD